MTLCRLQYNELRAQRTDPFDIIEFTLIGMPIRPIDGSG